MYLDEKLEHLVGDEKLQLGRDCGNPVRDISTETFNFSFGIRRYMKNTVVGVVITLNDIICKPATTHGKGEVIIE